MALLDVQDLSVDFLTRTGPVRAVDRVSFAVEKGEVMGLVGESGSGKTVSCRALLHLLPNWQKKRVTGRVLFNGVDLLTSSNEDLRDLHGSKIGMIFQNPSSHLDPLMTIGRQVAEPLIHHRGMKQKEARREAIELLRQVGVDFELMLLREAAPRGPDVNETPNAGEPALDYVTRVTREKVEFAYNTMLLRKLRQQPVLAADTTVVVDGQILGKPANAQEAADMMTMLSGRTHQVMTSVAVRVHDDVYQATQISEVSFATLTPDMIAAYCKTTEPYDKAGGYAVQGLAAVFIEKISGSYSSIMGLPLFETAQLLRQAGIKVL